jgi:ATP-dependent Clp protease ATP-binding subunit ClpB
MSEFMEKHMVARLLGAPPGYVDSEAGGFLTEAVRQRPYSVILFDEVEKAHPDVFNILLQVLEDGRLTDSRGRVAHFRDAVIIMTSNVGSELILDHDGSDDDLREEIEERLRDYFRPEFLNRVDEVLIFDRLGKDELAAILEIQLRQLRALLEPQGIELVLSESAKSRLIELGYEPAFGARPLKRVLVREVQDPLAEALLRQEFRAGDTITIDSDGDSFVFVRA